jgi:hypothetical protein
MLYIHQQGTQGGCPAGDFRIGGEEGCLRGATAGLHWTSLAGGSSVFRLYCKPDLLPSNWTVVQSFEDGLGFLGAAASSGRGPGAAAAMARSQRVWLGP